MALTPNPKARTHVAIHVQATITPERMAKYLDTTKRAMAKVKIVAPPKSYAARMAENFLGMATTYYNDACHNAEKGDYVNAHAQVNYAHGWLDAGARLGIFDVGQDDVLFTLLD